jgi:hypothetical protein
MLEFNQAAEADIAAIAAFITGCSPTNPVVRHLFEADGNSHATNVEIARRIAKAAREHFKNWEVCLAAKSAFGSYASDTVLGLIVRRHPTAAPAFDPAPLTSINSRGTRIQIARNQKLSTTNNHAVPVG